MNTRLLLASVAALGLVLAAGRAQADEGMWTVDNFPAAKVREKYGVTVDKAWLDRVQGAAARIPGCSASVVSRDGLMMTNYHCVEACAGALSSPQQDYFATGFLTASRSEEKQCPGMTAEILQSIEDVTARVKAAGQGKTGAELIQATGAVTGAIEKEACNGQTGLRCQVISLYEGGQYRLYKYRRYEDVRLVFTPEFKTGFFGGDPDNFNFPRFNLDVSFLRLYDGGKPVSTPTFLKWNPAPPTPGEPIFIPGNPGSTQRAYTLSRLDFLRGVQLPMELMIRSELRGKLVQVQNSGPEGARLVADALIGLENSFKVFYGRLRALLDEPFLAGKRREEADLRAKVAADAALAAETGDPWAEIERAYAAHRNLYPAYYFLESNAGNAAGNSKLFAYARNLVRAAHERDKPAAERLPEYSDAALGRLQTQLAAQARVEAELEEIYLAHWLSKAREHLGANHPHVAMLLGRDSPETVAKRLVQGTRLADPAARTALFEGGRAAVEASEDPLIKLVLAMDPAAREVRKAVESEVSGPVAAATSRIARARFAVYGDSIYPDATSSLRITYGAVQGWSEGGQDIAPLTTIGGLYERATGQPPYDLPQSWYAARDSIDMQTVFNFSGTGDIIGGASGSPTLNAKGEVIGAVFDGNIHSLGGAYAYDPRLNRSVHVAASGIQEALLKVYGREALVRELNGGK